VEEVIDQHIAVSHVKNKSAERNYGKWWKTRLKGKRLNGITPSSLEEAQRSPSSMGHSAQFLRHVLNKAVRDGKVERNPFCQITLPRVNCGKNRFLSPQEESALLSTLGSIYGENPATHIDQRNFYSRILYQRCRLMAYKESLGIP
jgi:hypothetical protein